MNRLFSLLLAALLLAGLCVPALGAAESADERLARVTQSVKDTLGLDTEAYTDFYGDVSEQELGTVWSLRWSGAGTSLSVDALNDGTVVGYWRSDDEGVDVYRMGGSLPTLPKVDAAAAKAAANAFLQRVLDAKTERVELGEPASAGQLGSTSCRFYGAILLNGLPSPLSYSITVRGSDNAVTSFRRDASASSYLGGIPSATPAVGKDAAAETLRGTLKLELIYVTDENDETRAVLRYVPKGQETLYVDAQTGKLVSPVDELYAGGASNDAAVPAAAESMATERGLTQAELAGVEKLEGVLDRDALDKAVRTESAYKLDGFTAVSADYRLVKDGEKETVLCTLRYMKTEDEDGYADSRTFTLDARTGAVKSLYSWGRWDKDVKSAVSLSAARSAAEAFLGRYSVHAADFALYDTSDDTADGAPSYAFTFARKANGYFYPENFCTIQIDRFSGAVTGVSYAYDDAVAFGAATGLVSADTALDAWLGTYDVVLAYRSVPRTLDKSDAAEARLIGMGYTRFRTLLLTYALERESRCPGVDAVTGKPVEFAYPARDIAYGDVAGHWAAREIGTLAEFGVGYAGESFRPDKALTQWELVALLASTQGLRVDPENASADERDGAYNTAYYMGALARGERSDDAPVTRGALVRYLLRAAGFGPVLDLRGVFTCSYADRRSIPDSELGCAALAQGFGLVTNARYDAGASATRAVAAVMLCRLMEREA